MYLDRHDLPYTHWPWALKMGMSLSNTNTPCCVVITGPEHREWKYVEHKETETTQIRSGRISVAVTEIPEATKKIAWWMNEH